MIADGDRKKARMQMQGLQKQKRKYFFFTNINGDWCRRAKMIAVEIKNG